VSVTSPVRLSAEQEERAQGLHSESIVFICHDHKILFDDIGAMVAGGVTAKQVHISLDGQPFADRRTFFSSASPSVITAELARWQEQADPELKAMLEEVGTRQVDGFLRRALVALDYIYWNVDSSGGDVVIALEPEDIVDAKNASKSALVLGSEGARLLEGRLEVLRVLTRWGLRHLELSWAWETPVGAPQSDTSGNGLGPYGRELVRELNRLGVMVDLAHLAYQSMYDALDVSSAPVLISHTGARALHEKHVVLLPDEVITAVASGGGIIAMALLSHLAKPGFGQATLDQVLAHFDYVAELAGTDCIAIGPDYFPVDPRMWENWGQSGPYGWGEGVEDISKMLNLTRGLVSHGYSDDDVKKILGGNLLRFFGDVRAHADVEGRAYPTIPGGLGVLTEGTTPL